MELISIGNLEVENILVLVATEHSLDHELTALFVSIPDREYMIRRELCLEAKVSDSRNSCFFSELYLVARNLVEKFRRGQSNHSSFKIGLLTNTNIIETKFVA